LAEIVESGDYHVTVGSRLERSLSDPDPDPERCRAAETSRLEFQGALRSILEADRLDALIYPTWSNPPRLIGDLRSPAGDNSQSLAPASGFPAITVPMGFVYGTLPVGLQILGDAWSEPELLGLAYSYEQATHHRRPPASAPPLSGGS
jgi:Asp-tRNA(Asn)/Glu-tRNA(Gln) amidotransferase A subunit family amidase